MLATSPPRDRCQKAYDTTTSRSWPGLSASGANVRPCNGATCITRNTFGVTAVAVTMDAEVPKGRGIGDKLSIEGVRNIIAVSSGKGGVGKSTVAVNLAVSLALDGARVGVMDMDVYGPNVPIMLGVADARPEVDVNKLVPIEAYGVKLISMALLQPGGISTIK